jgi:hypothetical protein
LQLSDEPLAVELAQRVSTLIGMIMEDEVDGALTTSSGSAGQLPILIDRLGRAGEDITRLAAAAEVIMRRYGQSERLERECERE